MALTARAFLQDIAFAPKLKRRFVGEDLDKPQLYPKFSQFCGLFAIAGLGPEHIGFEPSAAAGAC
jgi:hypothetical protein